MRTRKTASTSIQAGLGQYCGKDDIVSGTILDLNRNDSFIRRPHEPIKKVRLYLWKDWNKFFKFAFVRNPWDLVLSWYCHVKVSNGQTPVKEDFSQWIQIYPEQKKKKLLKFRQHLYICMGRKIALDFVGRFERLEEDFKYVCERIGITIPQLGRFKSGYRTLNDYHQYYTPVSEKIVRQIFKRDIDFFGYKF